MFDFAYSLCECGELIIEDISSLLVGREVKEHSRGIENVILDGGELFYELVSLCIPVVESISKEEVEVYSAEILIVALNL